MQSLPAKFIVYTMGRCGSTLLQELSHQPPLIISEGEILNSWISNCDPFDFLRKSALTAFSSGSICWGFKLKTSHIAKTGTDPGSFLSRACGEGWKIIHLKRDNLLDLSLSCLYAKHSNKWFSYKSKFDLIRRVKPSQKIHIDMDELFRTLDRNSGLYEFENELLAHFPHLGLTYEEGLAEEGMHKSCLKDFMSYLNISRSQYQFFRTKMKKNVPSRTRSFSNYEQIVGAISKTPYRRFL